MQYTGRPTYESYCPSHCLKTWKDHLPFQALLEAGKVKCQWCGDTIEQYQFIYRCDNRECIKCVCYYCHWSGEEYCKVDDCHLRFRFLCSEHHDIEYDGELCSSCFIPGIANMFAGLRLSDPSDAVLDLKKGMKQKYFPTDALKFNTHDASMKLRVVSFNINGKSPVAGRKIVGDAFLSCCRADVVLLQDSTWIPSKVMGHFGQTDEEQHYTRYTVAGESKEASVAFDQDKFELAYHLKEPHYYASLRSQHAEMGQLIMKVTRSDAFYRDLADMLSRICIVALRCKKNFRKMFIATSYHGMYKNANETYKRTAIKWVFAMSGLFNLPFIVGGDFNYDLNNIPAYMGLLMPTHIHDPRRPNWFDWIVPSRGTVCSPVAFVSLFPLPPDNEEYYQKTFRHDGRFALCSPPPRIVSEAELEHNYDAFDPWAEGGWVLLSMLLTAHNKELPRTVSQLTSESLMNQEVIFDHSPMITECSITFRDTLAPGL